MIGVQDTADGSTMKHCLNCHTENPVDEVSCTECGMSLTRAPTGEEAPKARKELERTKAAIPEPLPTPGQRMRRIARALALTWASCRTGLALVGLLVYWLHAAAMLEQAVPMDQVARSLLVPLRYSLAILARWVTAAITWQWERVGAVVLLAGSWFLPAALIGLDWFVPILAAEASERELLYWAVCLVPMMPLLGLLAGIMLLMASWRSRRRSLKEWIEKDRLRAVAVVGVVTVSLALPLYYIIYYIIHPYVYLSLFILLFLILDYPLVM